VVVEGRPVEGVLVAQILLIRHFKCAMSHNFCIVLGTFLFQCLILATTASASCPAKLGSQLVAVLAPSLEHICQAAVGAQKEHENVANNNTLHVARCTLHVAEQWTIAPIRHTAFDGHSMAINMRSK